MFQVKTKQSGKVFTVYAVSGCMFLVFRNRGGGHWEWMDMDQFIPAEA